MIGRKTFILWTCDEANTDATDATVRFAKHQRANGAKLKRGDCRRNRKDAASDIDTTANVTASNHDWDSSLSPRRDISHSNITTSMQGRGPTERMFSKSDGPRLGSAQTPSGDYGFLEGYYQTGDH